MGLQAALHAGLSAACLASPVCEGAESFRAAGFECFQHLLPSCVKFPLPRSTGAAGQRDGSVHITGLEDESAFESVLLCCVLHGYKNLEAALGGLLLAACATGVAAGLQFSLNSLSSSLPCGSLPCS